MVSNAVLEQAIAEVEEARAARAEGADVTDRIAALIAPTEGLRHSSHAANMMRYHWNRLFSDSTDTPPA